MEIYLVFLREHGDGYAGFAKIYAWTGQSSSLYNANLELRNLIFPTFYYEIARQVPIHRVLHPF